MKFVQISFAEAVFRGAGAFGVAAGVLWGGCCPDAGAVGGSREADPIVRFVAPATGQQHDHSHTESDDGSLPIALPAVAADATPADEQIVRFVAPADAIQTSTTKNAEAAPPNVLPPAPANDSLAVDRVVRFVAPSALPTTRPDARVQQASTDAETSTSNLPVVPVAQVLPAQDNALPLPQVDQPDRTEALQPPFYDTPQLTADVRPFEPITDVTVDISLPAGQMPGADMPHRELQPEFGDARLSGGWSMVDFRWAATNMHHRPLYFEQVNIERYGYSIAGPYLQPIVSGAHFFAVIPALPYKMAVDCPKDCIYTLGHYRPGTCGVPWRRILPPWSWTGATVEGGAIAGLILLIP